MDITEHINSQGLSRVEICKRAKISRAYLSLIEKGKRRVGPEKVTSLAVALGVTVQELRPDLADVFSNSS